jgi:hypothetical protein
MKTQERYRVIRNFLFIGVFLFLSFTINAANAPITSVGSICNAVSGQQVTVPINVTGFNNIGTFYLQIEYDYTKIQYSSLSKNTSLTGLFDYSDIDRGNDVHRITLSWTGANSHGPYNLADGSFIVNLVFNYTSGPASLRFYTNGCEYSDFTAKLMNDVPKANYYINGTIDGSCNSLPTITANGPTSFCAGGSVELTASAGSAYKWTPGGAITKSITVFTSGSYTVEVTDAGGAKATSEATVVTVMPSVPVSVSIQASANPVCAGTQVTITPTPVNGGVPIYRWYVNNEYFANTQTLSFSPENGDAVYLEMTSSVACPSSNPAISNKINMTVNPVVTPSISIQASPSGVVCPGTQVTYTATLTNGGTSPNHAWFVNGVLAYFGQTFPYIPSDLDVVTCKIHSNVDCVNENERDATSNAINMSVSKGIPVSILIHASSTSVCPGTQVTYTATLTNGGTSPNHAWYVNGVLAYFGETFPYVPSDLDVVTCKIHSNAACVNENERDVTSNEITMTVNPVVTASVSIVAGANTVCAGTQVTFTATPVGGGTPAYQWKVNNANVGTGLASYTYTPANNDQVKVVMTSSLSCTAGNPATSNVVNMVVNPELPVSVSIAASQNPVCPNTRVEYTATPTNGSANPVYQWKVNGINAGSNNELFAYYPANGDVVTCILTSSASCKSGSPATSDAIRMKVVSAIEPTVSLSADPSGAVCEGNSVTFIATPAGGGDSPKYFWSKNGVSLGDIGASYTYVPKNGDEILVGIQSSSACAGSNVVYSEPIRVTLNPKLPVSVSVSASSNEVCEGTSVTFTATPVNEGTVPKYQWMVNGAEKGTNDVELNYTPENGDVVTCVLTSNLTCTSGNPATSKPVTMIVNPILEAAVSIAAVPSDAIVAGTSVTFTASPVNGGLSPAYQWKVNGDIKGVNNPVYSFVPNNGDVVSCVMTSNATGCISGSQANSNEITVPVITTGTTVLSYRFANPRIHRISGIDHFEFDVQLKADVSGSEFRKGIVNIDFNNSTLSSNNAGWIATPVSGSVTALSVSGSILNIELDVPNTLTISNNYQTLITVSGRITNVSGEAGIDFNEGNMNGKQFSKIAASPGLEFYQSPNSYDEANFEDTWVGRVYAKKYGWSQIGGIVAWADEVNSSVWEGDALVPQAKAKNLRIHKPATLTIPVDAELTVTGNTDIQPDLGLIIESDVNGTGSLITGTSSGTASVQRFMTTDAWHIVASPVSGQTINNFLLDNDNIAIDNIGARGMMDYNPEKNDWNNYFTDGTNGTEITGGNLETGKGFSMRTYADLEVTFTGAIHTGNPSANGLKPALWNCVGNPYTSAIGINDGSSSAQSFLTINGATLDPNTGGNLDPIFGAIYVWDRSDDYNGVWGEYTPISNAVTSAGFDVQQGQAFMVKMKADLSATSVSFTSGMQIHLPALALKSTNGAWSSIKLKAAINSQKSSTSIAFNSAMTKGLDPTYDAGLLRGGSDLVLYSKLVEDNGIPFAIQALPDTDFGTMIIPLGVESKTGGEIVFSVENMNLPSDCQVILEDVQSHTFTDLTTNVYTTTVAANSAVSDRFKLHTSYLSTKLDRGSLLGNLSAYAVRNIEIRINGNVSNQAVATLYDIQGRVVLVKTLEEGSLNVVRTPDIKSAIYMLSVNDNGKLQRFKIAVNE